MCSQPAASAWRRSSRMDGSAGPRQIQPAAGGIGPERPRNDSMLGEQVDDIRVAVVDGVLQRGAAPCPDARLGTGVEQQAYVLHPVEAGRPGEREIQVGGLAEQDIDCE